MSGSRDRRPVERREQPGVKSRVTRRAGGLMDRAPVAVPVGDRPGNRPLRPPGLLTALRSVGRGLEAILGPPGEEFQQYFDQARREVRTDVGDRSGATRDPRRDAFRDCRREMASGCITVHTSCIPG